MKLPETSFERSSSALLGLVSRRQRWGLTLKGWVFLFATALLFVIAGVFSVHPFLAITAPEATKTLVVEGWISEVGIKYAAEQMLSNSYDHAFITGGPISGFGGYTSDFNTYAQYGFSRLLEKGVPRDRLTRVPCRVTERDRTYSSAVVLRHHFQINNLRPAAINILTDAVHARRSRLLFESALGRDIKIGVIAVPPSEYKATRWWRYSAGVKDVFSEALAYTYARIYF